MNASSAVSLECPALGNPAPALSWFQNGLPVSPGPRLQVLEEGQVLKVGTDPSLGKGTGNQGTVSSGSYKGPLEYVTCTAYSICEVPSWSHRVHKYHQSLLATQEHVCHTQGQPRPRAAAPCNSDYQDLDHHTIAASLPQRQTQPPTRPSCPLSYRKSTNTSQSCFPRQHTEPQMGLRGTAPGHCEHLQPTCLL